MKTIIGTLLTLATLSAYGQSDFTLYDKIKQYEASPQVKKTLSHMHKIVLPASQGKCASFVRQGYMASGMMGYPGIGYAKDYLPFLNQEGWTNLVTHPNVREDLNQTPSGCAIIYAAINPENDKNGYIGHIEVRTKGIKANGYISDYYSRNPRTGLECIQKGKVTTKTRVFIARNSSPFHRGGAKVVKNIKVTSCNKFSTRGALVSDEFLNRKVIGVSCKFN
jgi:hypothetical protein